MRNGTKDRLAQSPPVADWLAQPRSLLVQQAGTAGGLLALRECNPISTHCRAARLTCVVPYTTSQHSHSTDAHGMVNFAVRRLQKQFAADQGMIAADAAGRGMRTCRVDGESGGGAGGRLYT